MCFLCYFTLLATFSNVYKRLVDGGGLWWIMVDNDVDNGG
jgi:hypothetical protein